MFKKKFFFIFLISILPVVFLLLVDFIITKSFFPNNTNAVIEKKSLHRISHPTFHHNLKSNINIIEDYGKFGKKKLVTNSFGFRDKKIREIKNTIDKKRIILIGDSFTEGVLLNYEDTYAGLIDDYFSKKNIQVLNAGLSSYSPSIYYAKIKYLIEVKKINFDELVVFLDMSDIWNEATSYTSKIDDDTEFSVKDKKHTSFKEHTSIFLNKNFYGTYIIVNFVHDYIKNSKNNSVDNFIKWAVSNDHKLDKWPINKKLYNEYGVDGLKKAEKYMIKLIEMTKRHEIKTTIVVYPWISNIYYNDLNSKHVEFWRKFSIRNNIKFINLFPLFVKEKRNSKENLEFIKTHFIPYDIHYNNNGHILIFNGFVSSYK